MDCTGCHESLYCRIRTKPFTVEIAQYYDRMMPSLQHFQDIEYCQGCLMANLSQELADVNERLRCKMNALTQEMVDRIANCIEETEDDELNTGDLPAAEAAQLLMNSWQGAIMKMKLQKSELPLNMFMRFFFSH